MTCSEVKYHPVRILSVLALALALTTLCASEIRAQTSTRAKIGLDFQLPVSDTLLTGLSGRTDFRTSETNEESRPLPILLKSSHEPTLSVFDDHSDDTAPEGFCCAKPDLPMTLFFVAALEVIPNYFNWRVSDDSTAVLSLTSWKHNMEEAFEWDNNAFTTNMFAHPIHGNVYFNAARSNGYNYWASSFFAGLGSFVWEMYGENNRGAINDWIMTTMGGITIGETLHRSAKLLRNNEQQGAGRSLREFGAFVIDPVGSVNRAMRGETSKVGKNPTDRYPNTGGIQMTVGYRKVGNRDPDIGAPAEDSVATGYVDMTMQYGNFLYDHERPFDSFRFGAQINFSDKTPIGRLQMDGTLWGRTLKDEAKVKHSFTFDQIFLYIENNAFQVGGQFFGATINSQWVLSDDWILNTRVQPIFALLTGINSEYPLDDRPYEFGTGAGIAANGTLVWKGYPVFRLAYTGLFSGTISGSKGRHVIQAPVVQGRVKISRSVGVGADYWVMTRHSFYDDNPDVTRIQPTFRLNVTFTWFKKAQFAN